MILNVFRLLWGSSIIKMSRTFSYQQQLIARVLRAIAPCPLPLYGEAIAAAEGLEDPMKVIVKSDKLMRRMEEFVTKRLQNAKSGLDRKKFKTALAVKALPLRLARLLDVYGLLPVCQDQYFTQASKLMMAASVIGNPVHIIEIPCEKSCAICDNDYCTKDLCGSCQKDLLVVVRTPGFNPGIFKNDIQALRRYNEHRDDFRAYIARKKPYRAAVERPKVAPQKIPTAYVSDEEEEKPQSRYLRRMNAYNSKKSALADQIIDQVAPTFDAIRRDDLRELVEDAITSEIDPILKHGGGFDITSVWTGIKNVMTKIVQSKYLPAIAIVAVGGALVAGLVTFIVKMQSSRYFIVHILRVLAALVAAGLVLDIGYVSFVSIASAITDISDKLEAFQKSRDEEIRDRADKISRGQTARECVEEINVKTKYKAMLDILFERADREGYDIVESSLQCITKEEMVDLDVDLVYKCLRKRKRGVPDISTVHPHDERERLMREYERLSPVAVEDSDDPIVKHVGKDDKLIGELVADALTAVSALTLSAAKEGASLAKGAVSAIHTTSTLVRDVKSLIEIFQPFVETIVGAVYESVTGKTWVPWSEKSYHEKIAPLLEEHGAIKTDMDLQRSLHSNTAFQQRVHTHIECVRQYEGVLMKSHNPPRYLIPIVAMRTEAEAWLATIMASRSTAKDRPEPVGIMLRGVPGVGKSTTLTQLCVDLAPVFHELDESIPAVWNDNMRFTKKLDTEFWDGYKAQPVLVFDDIFQSTSVDDRRRESLMIVSAINRSAFQLNMAALPAKEGSFLKCMVVMMTRNGGAKLASLGIESPGAVLRRIPFDLEMTRGGADPADWRYNMEVDGKVVEIDYITLVKLVSASVRQRHKQASEALKPVDVGVTTAEDTALAAKILSSAVRRGQVQDANDRNKPKGKGPVVKHGAGKSRARASAAVLEPAMKELDDLSKWFDLSDEYIVAAEVRQYNVERLRRVAETLDEVDELLAEKRRPKFSEYVDYICDLRRECVKQLFEYLSAAYDRTAEYVDVALSWIAKGYTSMASKLVSGCIFAWARDVWAALKQWTTTPVGLIVMAIGGTTAVAGIIGGILYATGVVSVPALEDSVVVHSRTERERKRDAAKARAGERDNGDYQIKNGRPVKRDAGTTEDPNNPREARVKTKRPDIKTDDGHYNAAGKLLPGRMRPVHHLYEYEFPVIDKMFKNIFAMRHDTATGEMRSQVVFLFEQYAATCLHVADAMVNAAHITQMVELSQLYMHNGEPKLNVYKVPMPKVIRVEDSELVFLQFDKTLPPAPSITHLLWTDEDVQRALEYGAQNYRLLYRTPKGERMVAEAPKLEFDVYANGLWGYDRNCVYGSAEMQTYPGTSGALGVVMHGAYPRPGAVIHTAGSSNKTYDAVITIEMVQKYCGDAKPVVVVPEVEIVQHSDETPKAQTVPYGVLKHSHSGGGKNTTALSPLAYHLMAQPDGLRPSTVPTIMHPTDPGKYIEKWKSENIIDVNRDDFPGFIDPRNVAYAKAPAFHHIPHDVLESGWRDSDAPTFPGGYRVLSPEEAVFGVPELGLAPIDFTTSAGYNWKGKKRFDRYALFGITKNEVKPTPMEEWDPDLVHEILRGVNALMKNWVVLGVTVDSLKAERRKPKRVFRGETRMFYAGSIVGLILSRMFRGSLTLAQKRDSIHGTTCVGINPLSSEWGELYKRMSRFPKVVTLDQINFDLHNQRIITEFIAKRTARVALLFGLSSCRGLHWLETLGFPREGMVEAVGNAMVGTALMSCCAVHISGSLSYIDQQVQSSGADRTSQDNSGRLRLTTRATIVSLLRESDEYADWMRSGDAPRRVDTVFDVASYGDDSLMTLDDDVSVVVTKKRFADRYEELFGARLTKPDKTPIGDDEPFDTWDNAEFLKRGFRLLEGHVVAPLERAVIEDSVFWVDNRSRAMSIAADTVRSASMEAALHGREYYDHVCACLQKACILAGVTYAPMAYNDVLAMYCL